MSLDSAFFSDTSREVSGDLGDENMKKTSQSDIEALLAEVTEEGGFDRLNHRKRPAQPPHRWSADYVLRNLGNVRRFVKMECYE